MGFIEWIKVHDVARKLKSKDADELKKNLANKFKWVSDSADRLGLPHLPRLTPLDLPAPRKRNLIQKKRKSFEFNPTLVDVEPNVDGMHKNILPPEGVIGTDG